MRIVVINGPNLNWLGRRQPEIYGNQNLDNLNLGLTEFAKTLGVSIDFFQANGEGQIIDLLQAAADSYHGVLINPGAYGHYSLAIADALAAMPIPVIEVHLTNVFAREEVRQRHVTAGSCAGYICGLGPRGYILAIQALTDILKESE